MYRAALLSAQVKGTTVLLHILGTFSACEFLMTPLAYTIRMNHRKLPLTVSDLYRWQFLVVWPP